MKLTDYIRKKISFLEEKNIDNAKGDIFELVEYFAGIKKQDFLFNSDIEIEKEMQDMLDDAIELRAQHIPLQHITGQAYFYGRTFLVNENVLVPRFDTEILIEEIIKTVEEDENFKGSKTINILDMCTGSGCILLTLLSEIKKSKGIAIDISAKALEIAKKNQENLKLSSAQFIESDLFTALDKDSSFLNSFDLLVSNPPYIKSEVIKDLDIEVRDYDPMLALDGGEDGLFFYRKIIAKASNYLKDKGYIFLEIGFDQAEEVSKLLENANFINVSVIKDYSGNDRLVKSQKKL